MRTPHVYRSTIAFLCHAVCACVDEGAAPFSGVSIDVTSCDIDPCSLWKMARGGKASFTLTAKQTSFERTEFLSEAPDVIEILDYNARHDVANVDIVARDVGTAALSLLDDRDVQLGKFPLDVRIADRLLFSPESDGPRYIDMIPGLGQHFTVDVGTTVTIHVRPYGGDDFLSGTFPLGVTVEEGALPPTDWLAPIASPSVERFIVTATRGDHDISVDALGLGISSRLRLTGR